MRVFLPTTPMTSSPTSRFDTGFALTAGPGAIFWFHTWFEESVKINFLLRNEANYVVVELNLSQTVYVNKIRGPGPMREKRSHKLKPTETSKSVY